MLGIVIAATTCALGTTVGVVIFVRRLIAVQQEDVAMLLRFMREMEAGLQPAPLSPVHSLGSRVLADSICEFDKACRSLLVEERRAQSIMEHARRFRSQFTKFMSHDLKSPLNAILGFTEVLGLQTDGPLNAQQLESVATIRYCGDQLFRLVTDVVDFSALDHGRLVLEKTWSAPVSLLSTAIGTVSESAAYKGVEIIQNIQPGMPPLHVDAKRIVQALSAVLGFLVRFMDRGSLFVRVHVQGNADELVVEIKESQPQIRVQHIEEVTGVSLRDSNETAEPLGGLGLSFKLARELVALHEGSLSCHLHEGIEFRITLPFDTGIRR